MNWINHLTIFFLSVGVICNSLAIIFLFKRYEKMPILHLTITVGDKEETFSSTGESKRKDFVKQDGSVSQSRDAESENSIDLTDSGNKGL